MRGAAAVVLCRCGGSGGGQRGAAAAAWSGCLSCSVAHHTGDHMHTGMIDQREAHAVGLQISELTVPFLDLSS